MTFTARPWACRRTKEVRVLISHVIRHNRNVEVCIVRTFLSVSYDVMAVLLLLRYKLFGLLRTVLGISWCLHLYGLVVTSLGLLDPEDGGITNFRNGRKCLPNATEYLLLLYINV